jgi:hypothetical protein
LWSGLLDEVAVYDRMLTGDEVLVHYVGAAGPRSARFNLGVFQLATPSRPAGEDPPAWSVTGYDKLYPLQRIVGDTYLVGSGTAVLTAASTAIATATGSSRIQFDGTAQSKTVPVGFGVWCLTDSQQARWLDVVNDLLRSVGYTPVWVDEDGWYRSGPYTNPVSRPVEWAFTVSGKTIVEDDRSLEQDVWQAPNYWRVVQRNAATRPHIGAGMAETWNANDGPLSVAAIGWVRRVEYVDAVDQAALQARLDQMVQEDRQIVRTVTLRAGPLPCLSHDDVVTLDDPELGGLLKCQLRSWRLSLDDGMADITMEVVA